MPRMHQRPRPESCGRERGQPLDVGKGGALEPHAAIDHHRAAYAGTTAGSTWIGTNPPGRACSGRWPVIRRAERR